MFAFPLVRHVRHRAEAHAGSLLHMFHQPVEHQHTMAAADNLRMHRQTIHALADEIAQVIEIAGPSFVDLRRRREPLVLRRRATRKRGEVVQSPGHRQFHHLDLAPENIGAVLGRNVADTAVVGRVIVTHQAAVIEKKPRHRAAARASGGSGPRPVSEAPPAALSGDAPGSFRCWRDRARAFRRRARARIGFSWQ